MAVRRGRPSAPTTVVENVIPALQMTEERYLLRDIHRVSHNMDSTIQWLARHGLLSNSQQCCNNPMGLTSREKSKDGKVWYCRFCKGERSVRVYSFFANSHITLDKHLELIFWWAEIDCKQSVVMQQVGLASEAVVKWYNLYRDIACMYCIDHPFQIGGPGLEVEIDESKFMHRKYHRGRYVEGHWVLGLIERGSNNCVLVPVPDRSAQTLVPIINAHCLPGTRIITDGWRAYNGLLNHAVVNHNVQFVDPNDRSIHTNTVEGNWAHVKNKYRNMHGTSEALWDTYIHEFSFRRAFNDNFVMNFLYWVRHYYPL